MLSNKNILLISPESWNHLFVSKHHYAIHLSKLENHVFFLNPPSNNNKIQKTSYPNLSVVDYTGFIVGLRYLPFFFRRLVTLHMYRKISSLARVNFDIVWSFDNSVFYDFDALPKDVLCISHIMDMNQDFQMRRAAKKANICFGVIPEIVEKLKKFNRKSFLVRHGVAIHPGNQKKVILPGTAKLKAMYTGSLDMQFINWNLLVKASKKFKEIDFIILGKDTGFHNSINKRKFLQLENVYLMDPVPSEELNGYLSEADILLLAYELEYYKNYATPHKLMEYLASGKPIVASLTKDYLDNSELLYMGSNDVEWLDLLKKVIKNLEECSSPKIRNQRRMFALENTYDKQIQRIENLLQM